MSLGLQYSSDEEEIVKTVSKDAFGLSSLPQAKKPRVEEASLVSTGADAAPHVLSEDPLNLKTLVTRPTDTQMNVNIPYEEMMLPLQGPENPFADRNRFLNQNALAGHVEEQSMSDHAFRSQHLTHSILGYSANPSLDPNAPAIVGSIEAAEANKFATLDTLRATRSQKRDLKRKRKEKGDLEVVDGEGAYVGPWAAWKGDDQQQEFLAGVEAGDDDEEEEDEEEEETQVALKKAKPKKGASGQETSVFHGKSMTDYQGRTYMSPPVAEAPNLLQEAGSQECFIPKVCIHTWTGHTQGVSVIRTFPKTGHLFISGSMDTKIKLWDIYTHGNCLRTFNGHTKAVKDICFSNDGLAMFFCAISGEPPQEPVVSSKSGKVYEKRLILKYIHENGTDPTTGEKLEESDLITIQASPENAAPRPPTHTSIPALLQLLQNEWDALVLSTHTLEKKYNATRQELSYSLYAQDAAQRVVARLIRERDSAREALANVQASMGIAPSQPAANEEDVEMAETGLPAEVIKEIEETHKTLSAARKKKKPPTGYASNADVKAFTPVHTIPSLHSASPAGITSLALSKAHPSQFLTGGNDHIVQLYDRSTDKVLASLRGHSKKVNHVAFREKEGDSTLILSAGADKIAKVWGHDSASGEYIPKATLRSHKAELTGLVVHPTQTIFGLSSADKTYSVYDMNNFNQIFRSAPSEDPFTSIAVHPDGTLFAIGTPNSTIHIYDIRTGAIAASLTPPDATPFTVNTLSFSENGYHLAAPSSNSTVAIWDLRHEKAAASIGLGEDFKINKVTYDFSRQFLGVAGSQGARVFANKSWEELVRMEEGGEVSDLAWGEQGKELWGATGREVRVWGTAASA